MKKILYGSASALIAVIGLSAFTAKTDAKLTAGWYLAPVGTSVPAGTNPLPKADFTRSFGTGQPTKGGIGNPCTTSNSIICAAYFNASSINVQDPNNGQLRFVTGTAE